MGVTWRSLVTGTDLGVTPRRGFFKQHGSRLLAACRTQHGSIGREGQPWPRGSTPLRSSPAQHGYQSCHHAAPDGKPNAPIFIFSEPNQTRPNRQTGVAQGEGQERHTVLRPRGARPCAPPPAPLAASWSLAAGPTRLLLRAPGADLKPFEQARGGCETASPLVCLSPLYSCLY